MRAEVIAIGTELLLGHIVNTNTAYLGHKLAELGIDVYYHTTVGDNPERLIETVKNSLARSDMVITCGGLGPTVDDITVQTLSELSGKRILLRNRVGSAPGLIIEYHDKAIISLPGPPRELEAMFERSVVGYLKRKLGAGSLELGGVIKSRTIKTTGLPESKIDAKMKDLLNLKPPTTVGIYAKLREVDLKIMAKAKNEKEANRAIAKIEKIIKRRLKGYIFGFDNETLEEAVAKILTKRRLTIAVAESCTGGFVANRLTNVSGSSKYFMTGVVAYSNESKENILGVSAKTIKGYGAVSKQAALEMADGIKYLACVDIGLSITGIAGPTGGTRAKPVGVVYVALVMKKNRIVKEFRFKGSREEIKFQASQVALDLIRNNI